MEEEKITISKKEYEKLIDENKRLKTDKEICDSVLDYLSKGAEEAIKNWKEAD